MSGQALIILPQKPQWPQQRRMLSLAVVVMITIALLFWVGECVRQHPLTSTRHPPWIYGIPNARFTVVEFADLECAYCRIYFPTLRAWMDAHPDVNWEWRHLPLASHEPAATQAARLAECAGEVGGPHLFWTTVEWLYGHPDQPTRLPQGLYSPRDTAAIQACLKSDRPDTIVHGQVAEARREEITATPTLRVIDRRLGRTVTLTGLVPPDVLSSAIDGLAVADETLSISDER
jgi:protein-disulfide isomerase